MSNRLDGFGVDVGLSIAGGSNVISASGAPGGDSGPQDAAPVGSLFLRKDIGTLYLKLGTSNTTADWTPVVTNTTITNSTLTPSFVNSISVLNSGLTTGLEMVTTGSLSYIDTNAGGGVGSNPPVIAWNNSAAGATDWDLGFGAHSHFNQNVTVDGNTFNASVQIVGLQSLKNSSFGIINYAAGSGNTSSQGIASLILGRSNASTVITTGAVTANDVLARLSFVGDDSAALLEGARIEARATGTWTGSSLPSVLEFYTTAASSTTPALRASINSTGLMNINNAAYIGADLVNNGALFQIAYTSSASGKLPVTIAAYTQGGGGYGPGINFYSDAGSTIGASPTTNLNGDFLGNFYFYGVNNANAITQSAIAQVVVDGTPGTKVPSRFEWYTSTSSAVANLAMTLNKNKNLFVTGTMFGASPYATAGGTNTYTATITDFTAYQNGQTYTILFTNANSGASTLNLNSVGAIAIQLNGVAVTSGQIAAGSTLDLVYDGTNFQIIGPSGSGGSGISVATARAISALRAY